MKEFELKYGCNPNQTPAKIFMSDGTDLPITILNGRPGYINLLDALNSWQLVNELYIASKTSSAASFKHVSPAGAAVGKKLPYELKKACFVDDIEGIDDSALACAYARARGADRMSSYGDWIALSDVCDEVTASIIKREVSDGIIAPGYSPQALDILKSKKKGAYNIIQVSTDYVPAPQEIKQVYGITFKQGKNNVEIDAQLLRKIATSKKTMPEEAVLDLIVGLITLKYTQSNSVCFSSGGQATGIGAGQQSRIHCTRLAGDKSDKWLLRQSPMVLELPFIEDIPRAVRDNAIDVFLSEYCNDVIGDDVWRRFFTEQPKKISIEDKQDYLGKIGGISLSSDAFFPFSDNIIRAHRSGVEYIAQPGGSIRDNEIIKQCDDYGIVMAFTSTRLFLH